MIVALDTNALLDVLIPNPLHLDSSRRALEASAQAGSLVVCDIVYAELCGQFDEQSDCDGFLADLCIRVEAPSREACFLASRIWAVYRSRGGKRDRILPDFLIGAHAQMQASRLLSRDRGFFRDYFPELATVIF
jgi:hypothetical protein